MILSVKIRNHLSVISKDISKMICQKKFGAICQLSIIIFSLQFQSSIKKVSDENKENQQLGNI